MRAMKTVPLPFLLLLLFTVTPTEAAENHFRYEARWGGLHAADFALTLERRGGVYENWFRLETRGLLDWIIGLRVEAESRGGAAEATPLAPAHYRVDYTNRRRSRTVEVSFGGQDGEATATTTTHNQKAGDVDPSEGGDQISPDLRLDVIDPLSGLAEAIRRLEAHLSGEAPRAFHLKAFDGRRRFDMEGEYLGRLARTILGTRHEVYKLRLVTRPVAGFRKIHRVLWDGSTFDLYLSRDGRFVPLQIDSVGPGPMINLVEECPSRCTLPPGD